MPVGPAFADWVGGTGGPLPSPRAGVESPDDALAIGNNSAPARKTKAKPANPRLADFGTGRSSRRPMRSARKLLDSMIPIRPKAGIGR